MSKAERRKRARQRAKERERVAGDVTEAPTLAAGGVAALEVATSFAEPTPAVLQAVIPTESDFITGPVLPRVPGPARLVRGLPSMVAADSPVTSAATAPADEEDEDEDEDEDDESEDEDDEDDEDEDGEEGDDGELDEQDALFNLACSAVEEGDALTWNQLVTWMLAAEVDDPRLAALTALLVTDKDTSEGPRLTGARVLEVLEHIGLEEIVQEARETVAAAPKETDETEEERVLVRTTARDLAAQAKAQLAGKPRDQKPIKASAARAMGAERAKR